MISGAQNITPSKAAWECLFQFRHPASSIITEEREVGLEETYEEASAESARRLTSFGTKLRAIGGQALHLKCSSYQANTDEALAIESEIQVEASFKTLDINEIQDAALSTVADVRELDLYFTLLAYLQGSELVTSLLDVSFDNGTRTLNTTPALNEFISNERVVGSERYWAHSERYWNYVMYLFYHSPSP